jgi:4-hydroxy-tetrahydrodipicolinate reductase
MKIILLGYGKMGKIIERVALDLGHQITARIDVDNASDFDTATGDVAIEFSHPDSAYDNVKKCIEKGVPVVCGTTGWLSRKTEIESLCIKSKGAFFYASNYSLGVNIFFKVNKYIAGMMNKLSEYEISMDEIHHTEQKDAPSGTAITLAEGILEQVTRKNKWVSQKTGKPGDLFIESFRIDQVPGTHIVKFESPVDDIEIKHIAHSREGFAKGAVMVAEWLQGKKGVFSMDDFFKF